MKALITNNVFAASLFTSILTIILVFVTDYIAEKLKFKYRSYLIIASTILGFLIGTFIVFW